MAYCGPRGIPHSVFLKWDQLDQDKAIAAMLAERTRCPNCGTVPSDWVDEDGYNREPPPYAPRTEVCLGCKAVAGAVDEIPEDQRQFYHTYLVRRGVAEDGSQPSRQGSPPS